MPVSNMALVIDGKRFRKSDGGAALNREKPVTHMVVGEFVNVAPATRVPRGMMGLILPILILALWQLSSSAGLVSAVILPSPWQVLSRLEILLETGELVRHVSASLFRLLMGLLIGGVTGISIGLATSASTLWDRLLTPTLRFLTPVPVLAWMPLVVLFFGTGESAKILLMAAATFFILFSATHGAVRALGPDYIEAARILGKSDSEILRKVMFPSALPAIFEGLRGALAISWVVLVAAEMIASQDGLGWLLWDARTFGRTTDAYVSLIVVGILGLIGDLLVLAVRNALIKWKEDFAGL